MLTRVYRQKLRLFFGCAMLVVFASIVAGAWLQFVWLVYGSFAVMILIVLVALPLLRERGYDTSQ